MLAALLDIIAPPRCAGCGTTGMELCRACAGEIGCSQPIRLRGAPELATIFAAGQYGGVLRQAILAFKYGHRRSLAVPLADAIAKRLHVTCEIIVPVPLHPSRERARGFNQAELLALTLARRWQRGELPVVPHALRRVHATHAQSKLQAVDRARNVKHAFAAGLDASMIAGRRVLLVDDVITTGATLRACASALRCAGARRVDAACVAMRYRPRQAASGVS